MQAVKVGKNFLTVSPLNGVVQIVSPAANANGLVIATGLIAASTGTVNLYVGATAPTSVSDLSKAIVFSGNGNAATGSNAEVLMPYPLFVPAGMGVWAASGVSGAAAIALTWDLAA